jgi:hypothetical protein
MKLIDIEADYYTALFYKEVLGYDLISIYGYIMKVEKFLQING